MNRIHVTKEGDKILISQMDDNHLKNTINFICREIEKCKSISVTSSEVSKFQKKIIGIDDEDLEDRMMDRAKNYSEALVYYLAEIALRGIDMSQLVQQVFERNGPQPRFNIDDDNLRYSVDLDDELIDGDITNEELHF